MRMLLGALALAGLAMPVAAQSFPVTIDHIFGQTTVEAAPKRVVSVGYHEQDFLYALDIAPVGVKNWWGEHPYATWPWADAKRQELGAEPDVMPGEGVNLEWVLAQDPDLIVATYLSIDDALYAELSKIAPVVASPAGFPLWGAPWAEELRVIDQATSGSTVKADAIIAELKADIAAQKSAHPQIEGKTGTNVYLYPDEGFVAWSSRDLASQFLIDLGLVFPPELDALSDEENRIDISQENMRLLDMDVAIWPIDAGDETQATVEAMPLYQNLEINKQGRSVWLDDGEGLAYAAMSFQTPLSLGYLIEKLPPMLAAAIDGDAATEVPSLK